MRQAGIRIMAENGQTSVDQHTLQALRELFDDDFDDLLSDYLIQAPDLAAQIAASAASGRTVDLAAAAHQLKATSATFGAGPLTEIAERLETRAMASDLDSCLELAEICLDETDRVVAALSRAPAHSSVAG